MPGYILTSMPEQAELEIKNIQGREIRVRWKLARHGEWIAWAYVPSNAGLFNEGVGFEARAGSPEAAKAELVDRITQHLSA